MHFQNKDELITEDDLTISQIVKTLSERKTVYTKIAWYENQIHLKFFAKNTISTIEPRLLN